MSGREKLKDGRYYIEIPTKWTEDAFSIVYAHTAICHGISALRDDWPDSIAKRNMDGVHAILNQFQDVLRISINLMGGDKETLNFKSIVQLRKYELSKTKKQDLLWQYRSGEIGIIKSVKKGGSHEAG